MEPVTCPWCRKDTGWTLHLKVRGNSAGCFTVILCEECGGRIAVQTYDSKSRRMATPVPRRDR